MIGPAEIRELEELQAAHAARRPLLVALCGRPGSGKSEAQKALEALGILSRDDGLILREFCMRLFGLEWEDVATQAGKLGEIEIDGQVRTVRWALGEMGKAIEAAFGEFAVPEFAIRDAETHWDARPGRNHLGYSFGSVRKRQGHVYRARGGIVLEIWRPGTPESPHDFDWYDAAAVTERVVNDGTVAQLHARVAAALSRHRDATHQ